MQDTQTKHRNAVRYTKLDTADPLSRDSELDRVSLGEDYHSPEEDDENVLYTSCTGDQKSYTVEDAVEAIGFGFFQIRLYVICGLFSSADSLEMMLLAVLSPVLRCEWQLEQYQVALITTIVFIGMCIMAPVWGYMGDRYGRQKTLYMVSFWIGYYGLLTTFSPTYLWVLILRGMVGGGMAGSPQAFAVLTEYLPSKYRAKFLLLGSVNWAFGTLFEIFLASLVIPTLGWRWLLAFSSIPALTIVALLKFLPESARYLVAAGDKKEALKILTAAAKLNRAKLPPGDLVQSKEERRGHVKDLFSPSYLRTTLHLWVLWFGTAFSYYGMVLASAEILQVHNAKESGGENCNCNLLKHDDYITMIISTIGEFAALPFNMLLIDRIGRKWMGAIDMFFCGVFFLLIQLPVSQGLLTVFIFAVRGFSQGMFNFVYIYTGEVYPTTIRTLGIGISSSWARVGAMTTPFVAQVLLDWSLASATWVYGGVCLVCSIVCILLPIETKGRALPQSVMSGHGEG